MPENIISIVKELVIHLYDSKALRLEHEQALLDRLSYLEEYEQKKQEELDKLNVEIGEINHIKYLTDSGFWK